MITDSSCLIIIQKPEKPQKRCNDVVPTKNDISTVYIVSVAIIHC